ncbi:PEGA domain-containing protein [Cystobacter fuscus]|nr:PEGA domain-containing protein [Cystobacter fuscus]
MLSRRVHLIALVFCLIAPRAFAQGDDDLLAPLTPSAPATKGKTTKAKKPTKAAKGKKPGKAAEAEQDDEADMLAPLVKKTELLVKFNGGTRGTRLLVDEKDLGPVSKNPVEVDEGEHTVVVRKPGYRDFSKRLTFKAGERTEVAVSLEATAGFVSVKADIAGARVLVDGEERGRTPLEDLLLSAGSHEIVVEQEGFRPESQRIAVRAGKEYTVNFNLRPGALAKTDEPRAPVLTPSAVAEPTPFTQPPAEVAASKPLTQRWYFWAGVGAVVAAAAVGTVVATSQPLSADSVCGGVCDGVINDPRGASAGGLRF